MKALAEEPSFPVLDTAKCLSIIVSRNLFFSLTVSKEFSCSY